MYILYFSTVGFNEGCLTKTSEIHQSSITVSTTIIHFFSNTEHMQYFVVFSPIFFVGPPV